MKPHIILLRGLTPTGKNKVLMAPLEEAGLRDVTTYIQVAIYSSTLQLAPT